MCSSSPDGVEALVPAPGTATMCVGAPDSTRIGMSVSTAAAVAAAAPEVRMALYTKLK